MRKVSTLFLLGSLFLGVIGQAQAAKPVKVFEDPAGDAGNNNTGGIPGVDQGGFDLVSGSIVKAGKNLEFSTTSAAMPPKGALPEGFRLLWHFSVDGEEFRLTIKSADVGKPDVIGGTGTERVGQVDMDGHFRLEQCSEQATPAVTLLNCVPVEYLEGTIDTTAKTITAIVPLKLIKAKTGSVVAGGITGAAATSCQICWVPHYAERSLTPHTVIDFASMSTTYKVPKK